ncbi:hypothetical protein CLOSTMETH_03126 [[Clostridium] methylpentosum DSM 5476]|uniref:Uncharacterized protein n=1 Tax=[Clostridium] methylpentosum DSM 5476 TaxID=537013 RepID=C0EGY2_9FIRM|nr:hypothetical protein CLOSTMETH_03126 [[Clostridium] methylpentosum DSM 5476]
MKPKSGPAFPDRYLSWTDWCGFNEQRNKNWWVQHRFWASSILLYEKWIETEMKCQD